MTRETIITCDRCGYRSGLGTHDYFPIIDKKNSDEPLDLCPDCYDKYVKWWQEGKKE